MSQSHWSLPCLSNKPKPDRLSPGGMCGRAMRLVPAHPVFDCSQYTKWRGEGVGEFIMQVMSMSAYVERKGKREGRGRRQVLNEGTAFC